MHSFQHFVYFLWSKSKGIGITVAVAESIIPCYPKA